MTTKRGVLKNYINNKDEILLVAGGGGGYDGVSGEPSTAYGGAGGGTSGSSGYYTFNGYNQPPRPTGGTQDGPGTNGFYLTEGTQPSFGCGGFGYAEYTDHGSKRNYGGGGGGGWYGGGGGVVAYPGAGGSGHINSTYITEGQMSNGIREGSGFAKITLNRL